MSINCFPFLCTIILDLDGSISFNRTLVAPTGISTTFLGSVIESFIPPLLPSGGLDHYKFHTIRDARASIPRNTRIRELFVDGIYRADSKAERTDEIPREIPWKLLALFTDLVRNFNFPTFYLSRLERFSRVFKTPPPPRFLY